MSKDKEKELIVTVQYHDQAQPMEYRNVSNTYQKGDLFCVYVDGKVYKHPIPNIWRISESYGKHQ